MYANATVHRNIGLVPAPEGKVASPAPTGVGRGGGLPPPGGWMMTHATLRAWSRARG